ncbi:hypothetical protein ICW40_17270 [Actinotalea ferrariae]|uniref:hypothetical protein n=1 Tax=Actinotalea ferrariae TaxID=1386098 RepID=UPI001C8C1375|nr:hypothetical protein [Actinotalea ferrariae]MBX9246545.1 hypothetical protein [Actinotalea ferrariae]
MKRKLIAGATTLVMAAALAVGPGGAAQAVPASATLWTLSGQTPISSGYMYTYRSPSGGWYVSANFMGSWFVQYDTVQR